MKASVRRLVAAAALAAGLAAPAVAVPAHPAPAQRVAGADLAVKAKTIRLGDALQVTEVDLPAVGDTVTLDLVRFAVFAPDAEIVVHGRDGETRLKAPANVYFRGRIAGEPGSRVFLETLANGQTRGVVSRAGEDTYLIDSAESADATTGAPGRLQAQRADAALLKAGRQPWQCEQHELPPAPTPVAGWDLTAGAGEAAALASAAAATEAEGEQPQALPLYAARVAIETDYELYQRFGNTTAATNYVGNLIGYASTIYSDEIDTALVVQSVSLWTSSNDPWSQTSTLCGLMEFGRYWNRNRTGVPRTIAHFMSGKQLGGGIAWLGVLCQGAFNASASCPGVATDAPWGGGYGFSASLNGGFDVNNPTVMWDIVAITHEIGHNFNSPHSHCYGGIGGNSSPIDQCSAGQQGQAGCYGPGPTSLPGPPGAGSGTLMSYCHLVRSSYSDLSFSFGTGHPYGVAPGREASRMSGYVASVAAGNPSCLVPVATNLFVGNFEGAGLPSPWALALP